MLTIEPIPALQDNYIWLLHSEGQAIVIDPGAAKPVLEQLEKQQLSLQAILLTHHHHDHCDGVAALKNATGARVFGPAQSALDTLDQPVQDGDRLCLLGSTFVVSAAPGHTLDHMTYYSADSTEHPSLFCGDTLFSAGCGRLFEGDAQQLLAALEQIQTLPPSTQLYCAHEYTLANLTFAQAVEPDSGEIQSHIDHCCALRHQGKATLPSTLSLELRINPFLRYREASVIGAAEQQAGGTLDTPLAVLSTLRQWKDHF